MDPSELLRLPRVLVCLVVLGFLWPANQAGAQGDPAAAPAPAPARAQAAPAACPGFTKADAVKANGGPLGSSIWGQLCQSIDGRARYPEGVAITVREGAAVVGTATTDEQGVFVVPIDGNGTYQVILDAGTLPDGFSLTRADRGTLDRVRVKLGDQRVTFRLGADSRGQRDLADYATTAAKGLRLGLILAVAAMGLSLVYGVTGLTNFAHAELVTGGAIAAYLLDRAGIPFWLTVPLGVVVGAALGFTNDRVLWRPLRRRRMALLSMMVVSIGLSTAGRNAIQVAFGPAGKRYGASSGQREAAWGPFRLTPNDLTIMAVCVVVLIAMTLLLRRTRVGTAIRAVADNADLAASSGIAVDRIISVVWVLCGGLAALGGIFYGLTVNVRFDMGFILLLSMFAAVVLGGLGNAYGAVLGALVIGVVQEISGLFIDTAYKFVVALAVLILVLLIRPQGILGHRERFG
ncbi:MAG: High-affinity branched-chain amino acid transport system permease protein LivH [Acidimicrobiales bacterium]|nr:High-affinity branched-chain amino acid transport system permease protein LivH [Acidimicrobiales bacterium]